MKKTVTFTLSEPTEVFVRYDLGQSHGCCADHTFGDLRIIVDGIEVRRDHISFVNYGVQPISESLEDFDYFFPSQVVMGFDYPISRLDPNRLGPLLENYKRVDRQGLGNLGHLVAGSHTFELELGDAGWNSIFEIYSELPQRPIAPDATALGPLKITSVEYQFPAAVIGDVLRAFDNSPERNPILTELWARVYMPASLANPPYPLLVFLHGNHQTCKPFGNEYALTGICPAGIIPNHEGYGYLAERLASWGYVVVSINANRGFPGVLEQNVVSARGRLVLKHLQKLSEWNSFGRSQSDDLLIKGREMPDVLKGALDFTQVGLLGHSVGGEGVRAAYNFYQFGGDLPNVWPTKIPNRITFRGIFEIAPSDGQEEERLFNTRSVKWNVLLPMCDGDNSDLPGVKPFDRMIAVGDQTQKSTFTVWGANHNFYNTEWQLSETGADCSIIHAPDGNLRLFPAEIDSPLNEVDPLSGLSAQPLLGRTQRQTALASVIAFFRGNVGRNANPDFNQIFNPEFALPPVVTTVTRVDRGYTDGPARVFEDFSFPLTGVNKYGLPNDIVGVTMLHGINVIPDHNGKDGRGRQTNRPAGLISWEEKGAFFQTNWRLPGVGANISQFQTLEFRVSRQCTPIRQDPFNRPCFDPGLNLLNPTEPTNFSVRLMLGDGTLSEPVQLAAYTDLAGPVGSAGRLLVHLHPILQTVRIPLADFREPLTSVRGVRFTFDDTPTGAIFMSDIRVSGRRR